METAGGVAYQLNITLPTYSALEGQPEAVLWVHESIRDDAWTLFGFLEETERELFRQLVGVSGVGAGTARMILSAIPAAELPGVIAGSDLRRLKGVKGVGAKTAERIIARRQRGFRGGSGSFGNARLYSPAEPQGAGQTL